MDWFYPFYFAIVASAAGWWFTVYMKHQKKKNVVPPGVRETQRLHASFPERDAFYEIWDPSCKFDPQDPSMKSRLKMVRDTMLKRGVSVVKRFWKLQKVEDNVKVQQKVGICSPKLQHAFECARVDLEGELLSVRTDAEEVMVGWGKQVIQQCAQLASQEMMEIKKQQDELRSRNEAERGRVKARAEEAKLKKKEEKKAKHQTTSAKAKAESEARKADAVFAALMAEENTTTPSKKKSKPKSKK